MGIKTNTDREDVLLKVLHENEIFVSNTKKKDWENIKNAMRQFANKCIDFERESAKCKLIDDSIKAPFFRINEQTKFNILKRCWTVVIETINNSVSNDFYMRFNSDLYNSQFEKEIAKVVGYNENQITSSYSTTELEEKTIFTIDIYIL